MNASDMSVTAGLYLRGADLTPHRITETLQIQPSVSRTRGETRKTPSGAEYVTKIGLWGLVIKRSPSEGLEVLDELFALLGSQSGLSTLPGVQEAYFDLFIASDADENGDSSCAMALSVEQTQQLSRYNLPLQITITITTVKP